MPEHLVIRHPPPPLRLRRPRGCESWCFFRTPDTPPGCALPGRCRRPLCSPYPVASGRTRDTGLIDRCGRRPQASQDGWKYCLYSSQVVLLAVCGLPHGSGFACCTLPYLFVARPDHLVGEVFTHAHPPIGRACLPAVPLAPRLYVLEGAAPLPHLLGRFAPAHLKLLSVGTSVLAPRGRLSASPERPSDARPALGGVHTIPPSSPRVCGRRRLSRSPSTVLRARRDPGAYPVTSCSR